MDTSKLEKVGKVIGSVSAIGTVVIAVISFLVNTFVIQPINEDIEDLRQDQTALAASVQGLQTWRSSNEEQSRNIVEVLRERLSQHELAMMGLRGAIEALRIELRLTSGSRSPGVDIGLASFHAGPTRPPESELVEGGGGSRSTSESLLLARRRTDESLRGPDMIGFGGDPLEGLTP